MAFSAIVKLQSIDLDNNSFIFIFALHLLRYLLGDR